MEIPSQFSHLKFSPGLLAEIEIYMGDPDEPEWGTKPFEVALMEVMQDSDDPCRPIQFEFRNELREIGIKLGIFGVITEKEMANSMVISTDTGRSCKKYDFKKKGVCYRFVSWKPLGSDC